MNALVTTAQDFALKRHHGQTRPLVDERPVAEHLAEVANLVELAGGTPEMIAAAWLHDVVEDTDTAIREVSELLGEAVAALVDGLTDPPHFAPIVLHERKALQTERIALLPWDVQVVKVADQTSNVWMVATNPVVGWTAEKCVTYARGAKAIVAACSNIPAVLIAAFEEALTAALSTHQHD